MPQERNFSAEREEMVMEQLEARGVKDKRVLAAFRKVRRDKFIPSAHKAESYQDHPVPIGSGQTISQPYIVALMTECLRVKETDRILEVGTGSGYQTAILAELCWQVYSIERFSSLTEKAKEVLAGLGYGNISLKVGDGSCGWEEYAPYNGIIVTAGAPSVPDPLKDQLGVGGRLVVPTGGSFSQVLVVIEKEEQGLKQREICGCVFVPLVGKYGWSS